MIINSFFKTLKKYPKRLFLSVNKKQISYNDFYKILNNAILILRKNLNSKKKIIIALENSEYSFAVLMACLYLRITIFPINPETNLDKIVEYAKETKVKYFISEKNYKINKPIKQIKLTDFKKYSYEKKKISIDFIKKFPKKDFNYIVSQSSGITGKSKKIIFTSECKYLRAINTIKLYKLKKKTISIICTPIYHSLAQRIFFVTLLTGGSIVIFKKFSLNEWYSSILKYKVSFSMLVSTHLRQFLYSKKFNFKKLKSLKTLVSTSDALKVEEKNSLRKKIDCNFHEIYGTSETATISDLKIIKTNSVNNFSVGKPLSDTKVIIKNKKNKIGEIYCKNSRMFKGYYGSNKKFRYFPTGDFGFLDRKGYLHYSGRKKDLIKISGINILPFEVEKKINRCQLVKESVVIGIDNSIFGELIKLIIVPKKKDRNSIRFIKKYIENNLNEYEKPQVFEIRSNLPKNSLGKIDKPSIKKNEQEKFELEKNNNSKYLNLLNKLNEKRK